VLKKAILLVILNQADFKEFAGEITETGTRSSYQIKFKGRREV
jgi:hypothetical protein